jgi:hypothetical protein
MNEVQVLCLSALGCWLLMAALVALDYRKEQRNEQS